MLGQTVFVRPLTDPAVRAPADGQRLPAEGRHVEWSEYWARRVQDGDVELTDPPAEEPAAPAPAAKTSSQSAGDGQ
jgi:hypothetical protein